MNTNELYCENDPDVDSVIVTDIDDSENEPVEDDGTEEE